MLINMLESSQFLVAGSWTPMDLWAAHNTTLYKAKQHFRGAEMEVWSERLSSKPVSHLWHFIDTCLELISESDGRRSDNSGSDGNRAAPYKLTVTQFLPAVAVFCPPVKGFKYFPYILHTGMWCNESVLVHLFICASVFLHLLSALRCCR